MSGTRNKISVCIAAYQGERFIASQLRSILEQLSEADEVIIVDDYSLDMTCDRVRAFADSRIHLIEHAENRGVSKSFEEAILRASGKLIFLSDQDDVWVPGKVHRILEVFEKYPDVTLVTTDATLIDEDGSRLADSYYAIRGKFSSGLFSNLVRCNYLGCTMAFRSELTKKIIPFPNTADVLHDIWIGMVNSISFGATRYLDEPLVWYRRHSQAVTGSKLSLWRQIWIRLQLVRALVGFCLRNLLARRVGT
jgi:glycosyltransferase involved in cell wall biosynthesis